MAAVADATAAKAEAAEELSAAVRAAKAEAADELAAALAAVDAMKSEHEAAVAVIAAEHEAAILVLRGELDAASQQREAALEELRASWNTERAALREQLERVQQRSDNLEAAVIEERRLHDELRQQHESLQASSVQERESLKEKAREQMRKLLTEGRTDLLRTIFALDERAAGEVVVLGSESAAPTPRGAPSRRACSPTVSRSSVCSSSGTPMAPYPAPDRPCRAPPSPM
jgi:hypothetical protein